MMPDLSFNTNVAKHFFCSVCGVNSFYVPRSHPEGYSVNARCLDGETVEALMIEPFNGREWERQYPEGRGALLDVGGLTRRSTRTPRRRQ
jgi:hypothetical protein